MSHIREVNSKMDSNAIREKINENNLKIEELLAPSTFVLNKEIYELLKENEELRKQCVHEFDEMGVCIYCDTEYEGD